MIFKQLTTILVPLDSDAQPLARPATASDDEEEELPPADAAEYALLEAVEALDALDRRTHIRAVTEYAFGLLPDAARAAARSSADLNAPLARAVERGWVEQDDDNDYDTTVRFLDSIRAPLLKMLGVTAGLDRLAFISALEQLAPQA